MGKCGTSAKTYTLNIFRGFLFHLKISSRIEEKRERVAFCAEKMTRERRRSVREVFVLP